MQFDNKRKWRLSKNGVLHLTFSFFFFFFFFLARLFGGFPLLGAVCVHVFCSRLVAGRCDLTRKSWRKGRRRRKNDWVWRKLQNERERKDEEKREKREKEKIGQVLVQGRPCVSLLTIFTKIIIILFLFFFLSNSTNLRMCTFSRVSMLYATRLAIGALVEFWLNMQTLYNQDKRMCADFAINVAAQPSPSVNPQNNSPRQQQQQQQQKHSHLSCYICVCELMQQQLLLARLCCCSFLIYQKSIHRKYFDLRLGCLCVKLLLAHCGSFHLSSLSCYIVSPYTARYLSVLSSIIWKINSKTVSNSSVGRTVIRTRILYRNILRFDFKSNRFMFYSSLSF